MSATHHTCTVNTWVDVVYTNNSAVVLDVNNLLATFPRYHNIIDVTINIETASTLDQVATTYRDLLLIQKSYAVIW